VTSPTGTSSASTPPQLTADGRARLATALELEHQAVYGYGALGPYLASDQRQAAVSAESVHRKRRDALEALLGDGAPAGQAAYALPEAVTDPPSAVRLAALIEDGVTTAYRAALASIQGAHRKLALDAMVDAATRAAAWRRAGGQVPGTVSFPGRPS
jgi:Domain of unknown function (DUF4439)